MPLPSSRWHVITESSFTWEQDALDFVRERLPDQEPYHAWTNFEFLADQGSIYEVDLLVLAPSGFYLIEIKSRPGAVEGDAHTWTWRDQGNEHVLDNPLLLANRKAKRLISLIKQQRAVNKLRLPFLEPLVFCSAPGLKVKLQGAAAAGVRVRDREEGSRSDGPDGMIATLTRPPNMDPGSVRIDRSMAGAIVRALDQAGIKRSQKARRVGDYELGALILDGPAFQDYEAKHVALPNVTRRIRLYQAPRGASAETRRMIIRAAQREFHILEGLAHPGILRVVDYRDHERGPALIFEHRPEAVRLDHFLAQQGARLNLGDRLGLLRQLAEAVRYAHDKRLVHRALGPQSVLVLDPDSPGRRLQIFNWQAGARDTGTTTGRSVTATSHLEQLVEEATTIYLAPEALADPGASGEYLDVFSLGAIAYHLFAGQPPASSVAELSEKLRQERGLQLSAVLDGAGKELQDLVAFSTHPDVAARLATLDDFLDLLERVEDEVTRPEEPAAKNPTEALAGDLLSGGLTVKQRLGSGSTSIVLLVATPDDRELVLKVAASAEYNDRLRQEADILRELRHQHIVAFHELREIDGHAAILMDRAGKTTLATRLKEEGALHLELLERFGEDLLQTVSWLEQKGVPHRDIKPANIGIAEVGAENRLHLVLFDFSLSKTPLEQIRAGTVPYLDPFLSLRKPPRWDLAAERFAAAVTLYEMATARVPIWGDGRSDPAVLEQEVSLDPGLFDPDLRERMVEFFQQALRRDAAKRFDNADEMLAAWRKVFVGADTTKVETGPAVGAVDFTDRVAQATRETSLGQIGLSTRAQNALERQHVLTTGDLVSLSSRRLYAMPGVGSKTRAEIRAAKDALAKRLAALHPGQVPQSTTSTTATTEEGTEVTSIDLLAARLPPRGRRPDTGELRILAAFLDVGSESLADNPWPKQSDVAARLNLTRARIGQVVTKARARWAKDPSITRLRTDIIELLERHGRVMTAGELAQALLTMRGSEAEGALRTQRAMAVARAAIEAERERAEPRFTEYRFGALLVALDEAAADFAGWLGDVADRLADSDPLLPPARALEELGAVDPPEGVTGLTSARLVQLAAAASTRAAASSRLEIYPRKMPAERALRLAQGALVGLRELREQDLRERVSGRYPEAEPLPERPELDALLRNADLGLEWDPQASGGRGAYRPIAVGGVPVSSSTTIRTRITGPDEIVEEDAQRFEDRLQYALRQGSFLVLGVPPRLLQSAERRLARKFPVRPVSIEALLVNEMRKAALQAGADWRVVREADAAGPAGPHWLNLLRIVGRAATTVEETLVRSDRPILAIYPGLLARYDRIDLLQRLSALSGNQGGPPGVWLLLPTDGQQALPVIDGRTLPLISASQWVRIPELWIHDAAA